MPRKNPRANDQVHVLLKLHEDIALAVVAEKTAGSFSRKKALSHHETWGRKQGIFQSTARKD